VPRAPALRLISGTTFPLVGEAARGNCPVTIGRPRQPEEMMMRIHSNFRLPVLSALAVSALLAASPANAYAVICKHGKYDIDSRDETQLKSAFGTSYCTMRRFNYRSDAENFAKSNNMQAGKSCSCR
jgi:hypothetical protein